jgi:hypothetical protein
MTQHVIDFDVLEELREIKSILKELLAVNELSVLQAKNQRRNDLETHVKLLEFQVCEIRKNL